MKYFEVEVTRTVTERRRIYVSAENGSATLSAKTVPERGA
jgi:hypothetical protein